MYDFLDRPLTELNGGARFFIRAMRQWVRAMYDRQCPASAIAGAFRDGGLLGGLHSFLRMMALFNRHGRENFQFCALDCNHVSEHEAILTSLVCDIRNGQAATAGATLKLLVGGEAIGDLVGALSDLSTQMACAGLHPERPLPLPPQHLSGSRTSRP